MNSLGRVFWITGLAGAGKTSIGKNLYRYIKNHKDAVVYLDGDRIRSILDEEHRYDLEARIKLALKYGKLCKYFSEQGIDVICSTISMFSKCYAWNRKYLPNYTEIYIRVPFKELVKRDQKKLYSSALQGQIKNVVGVDLFFDEPKSPNITLDNHGDISITELFQDLLKKLSGINKN